MANKFGDNIRGLTVFISDIRNCESPHTHTHTHIPPPTHTQTHNTLALMHILLSLRDGDTQCLLLHHIMHPPFPEPILTDMAPLPLSVGKSKEAERKRINKELANIRSKFKSKTKHDLSLLVGARQLRTRGFVFMFYKHFVYTVHSNVQCGYSHDY